MMDSDLYFQEKKINIKGVRIIIYKDIARWVIKVKGINDRLIMIKLKATQVDLVLIQAHMSTTDNEGKGKERIYERIEKNSKCTRKKQ